LSKKLHIEQTWHHIEDQLRPSPSRIVRQVMDIYTYDKYLEIDFEGEEFYGLQINGRNPRQELAFIHQNDKLFVNLGDLSKWPDEMDIEGNSKNRKHIKLEIEYRESPEIDLHEYNGYTGFFTINWPIRPEFIITLPLGMNIKDKGHSIKLSMIIDCGEAEILEDVALIGPDLTKRDDRHVYSYVINDDDYQKILNTPDSCDIIISCEYDVENDIKFWALPFFAIILITLSLAEIVKFLTAEKMDIPDLGFLIALFSFSFLILALHKENYEIPLEKLVDSSIILTIILIGLVLLVYLNSKGLSDVIVIIFLLFGAFYLLKRYSD